MAGNFQGDLSGDILVEFDYNNIVLVDPNKTIDSRGVISERIVDHEDLVMFANLEAETLPRTKLALGTTPNNNVSTSMTIAKINFLRPNKSNYMTSGYLDEITGKDSLVGRGQNQKQEKVLFDSQNRPYFENTLVDQQNVFDNGLLGITSIRVKTSASFVPSVSIELEDVQGRALFQLGDQSPYAAFFNLPYPQFYLTMKGYYGKAIKYQLNLEKFDARFNSATGNYSISLEFRGFKFNVLNEVLISHLMATPHMYNKRYSVGFDPAGANTATNDNSQLVQATGQQEGKRNTSTQSNVTTVQEYVSERGYEKIKEVYSEYKSKGLLPPDFPELTLMQFTYKMDMFEQNVINSYPKVNVEPLTNIKNYQNSLKNYFEGVRGTNNSSWFRLYLDPRAIVLNDNTRIYFFNQTLQGNLDLQAQALKDLESLTKKYNEELLKNPTLGFQRKDEIKLNNLGYDCFFYNQLNFYDIDTGKTAANFFNVTVPTPEQVTSTLAQINTLRIPVVVDDTKLSTLKPLPPYFFVFQGDKRFDNLIRNIESESQKKLSIIQQAITQDLANFISDSATGIGFNPTVRNVVGIIMANAEAFIRLMDEVHTNAWSVRNEPTRKLVIQNNTKSIGNPEAFGVVQISTAAAQQNQGLVNSEQPVYPWPQFFVETPDDKKGRFQLKYLGDKSVVELTQAYNYKIWPEVEFVEEYLKGLAQKDNPPFSQPPLESQLTTDLIQFNAIEYPPSNLPYLNKQIIKYYYEIWERQYITSYYSNFIRIDGAEKNQFLNLNTSAETQNILTTLGNSNPFLSFDLKYKTPNAETYPEYLRAISANGTGRLFLEFERGFFTTPYITEEVNNPFKIYKTTQLGLQPLNNVSTLGLNQIVKSSFNQPKIIDTYPFRIYSWVTSGMSLSNQSTQEGVYNTNKSLKVFEPRNVISNFTDVYNYTLNRPVTNFCYLETSQPTLVTPQPGNENTQLNDYYLNNRQPSKFLPTVGFISNSEAKNLPKIQITSVLNSPYFVNAIINGVDSQKRNENAPYKQAAYLFLNSLPLATLRERYKNLNDQTQLDYIASCFNKFGGIHKLPYVWILKLGSVWHRYKTFVDTGTDILDTAWTNFDYLKNYDPTTQSPTKTYQFTSATGNQKIVLQETANNSTVMNVGFYPGLMNKFAYFYNGKDLFQTYSDTELQTASNNGLRVYNFPNSNITSVFQGSDRLTLKTWSLLLPSTLTDAFTNPNSCIPANTLPDTKTEYFIIPSFGININQTKSQCLSNPNANNTISTTTENITSNPAVFNGSVRTFWSAPNYGYFDSSVISKPNPDQYMFTLNPEESDLSPFKFEIANLYTSMEEIFGVFDKKTLDIMEKEFLEYCKPSANVKYQIQNTEIGASLLVQDNSLRNFQLFMRNIMEVKVNLTTQQNNQTTVVSDDRIFTEAINFQQSNLKSNIKSLMEYDVIVKNGNPSNYNRRVYNSFLQTPGFKSSINFGTYEVGSLPTAGSTTLLQSETRYPQEWETLRQEVGFSTIPGIQYSDNGSAITDFFIDNNIKFSVSNIILLSQIIKIYATQKQLNPSLTSTLFKSNLSDFLGSENTFQNLILNGVIDKVRAGIGPIQPPRDQSIQSQFQGEVGKTEIYNLFKALNDKWISGSNYSDRTLFEDILFLDRASRNIGEVLIIDIFSVKNLINSNALNERMSVYGLISTLLMQNNFTVMPMAAYTNFYNVLNVDGTNRPNTENIKDFGNNLWGTFTNVDYRNASPKMVCFYVGKPSEQLPLPKQISGYGDDGFDIRNPGNPLIENLEGKTDYEYSNKCVGFTVDIGIRNQNVFQNFSVSQDNGKATSESIAAFLAMIDQTNTRTVATQNASLFNMYKRRSYTCNVSCLGNAIIQPTMYFNLRHIPMFNGPYLILEVEHTITPGDFTTNFRGVRQGIFDMPSIDSYIQKLNQNLLTKIEAQILQQTDQNTTTSVTQQGKSANLIDNSSVLKAAAENACFVSRAPQFVNWQSTGGTVTNVSPKDFGDALKTKIGNNQQLQTAIYLLSYVRTYQPIGKKGGNFAGFNNNYGEITLDRAMPESAALANFINLSYACKEVTVEKGTVPLPVALFASLDKYIDFMISILNRREQQLLQGNIIEYYCTEFPSQGVSKEYFQQNRQQFYDRFLGKFQQALKSANEDAGLRTDFRITPTSSSGGTNNLNTTTATTVSCPTTTLSGFTPVAGIVGTIVTLSGTNMEYIRTIEVGNAQIGYTPVDIRSFQFISSTKIKFSIPTIPGLSNPVLLNIRVTTAGNTNPVTAPGSFAFSP